MSKFGVKRKVRFSPTTNFNASRRRKKTVVKHNRYFSQVSTLRTKPRIHGGGDPVSSSQFEREKSLSFQLKKEDFDLLPIFQINCPKVIVYYSNNHKSVNDKDPLGDEPNAENSQGGGENDSKDEKMTQTMDETDNAHSDEKGEEKEKIFMGNGFIFRRTKEKLFLMTSDNLQEIKEHVKMKDDDKEEVMEQKEKEEEKDEECSMLEKKHEKNEEQIKKEDDSNEEEIKNEENVNENNVENSEKNDENTEEKVSNVEEEEKKDDIEEQNPENPENKKEEISEEIKSEEKTPEEENKKEEIISEEKSEEKTNEEENNKEEISRQKEEVKNDEKTDEKEEENIESRSEESTEEEKSNLKEEESAESGKSEDEGEDETSYTESSDEDENNSSFESEKDENNSSFESERDENNSSFESEKEDNNSSFESEKEDNKEENDETQIEEEENEDSNSEDSYDDESNSDESSDEEQNTEQDINNNEESAVTNEINSEENQYDSEEDIMNDINIKDDENYSDDSDSDDDDDDTQSNETKKFEKLKDEKTLKEEKSNTDQSSINKGLDFVKNSYGDLIKEMFNLKLVKGDYVFESFFQSEILKKLKLEDENLLKLKEEERIGTKLKFFCICWIEEKKQKPKRFDLIDYNLLKEETEKNELNWSFEFKEFWKEEMKIEEEKFSTLSLTSLKEKKEKICNVYFKSMKKISMLLMCTNLFEEYDEDLGIKIIEFDLKNVKIVKANENDKNEERFEKYLNPSKENSSIDIIKHTVNNKEKSMPVINNKSHYLPQFYFKMLKNERNFAIVPSFPGEWKNSIDEIINFLNENYEVFKKKYRRLFRTDSVNRFIIEKKKYDAKLNEVFEKYQPNLNEKKTINLKDEVKDFDSLKEMIQLKEKMVLKFEQLKLKGMAVKSFKPYGNCNLGKAHKNFIESLSKDEEVLKELNSVFECFNYLDHPNKTKELIEEMIEKLNELMDSQMVFQYCDFSDLENKKKDFRKISNFFCRGFSGSVIFNVKKNCAVGMIKEDSFGKTRAVNFESKNFKNFINSI